MKNMVLKCFFHVSNPLDLAFYFLYFKVIVTLILGFLS